MAAVLRWVIVEGNIFLLFYPAFSLWGIFEGKVDM